MSLIPALAKADWPRITCTTSCMQFLGKFDLSKANESWGSYPNNKLFFQTWLTEFQSRVLKHDELKRITIHGVHPGYVQTGIWTSTKTVDPNQSMGAGEWLLNSFLDSVGIDAQQGSLTITYAATAPECGPDPLTQNADGAAGKGGGRYFNRIFEAEPMPQTKDPECRRQIWQLVADELKLEERGLLRPYDF